MKKIIKALKITTAISLALWIAIIYYSLKPLTVNTYELTNATQTIVFQEMVHIGNPEYYTAVNKKIADYKEDGYVYYYELIKINNKEEMQEMKQLIGIDNDVFNVLINKTQLDVQQNHMVKFTDKDIHADIDSKELVERLKEHYTTNSRPSLEFSVEHLMFDTTSDDSECSKPLSRAFIRLGVRINDVLRLDPTNSNDVIISQRNDVLINKITTLKNEKIIIQYGAFHYKDFADKMDELGYSSKKIDELEVF